MLKTLVGVMGPGEGANAECCQLAYDLGYAIAQHDWGVLTGGRNVGVMAAASRGAKAAGGLTIGILPDNHGDHCHEAVDIAIMTGMGSARNSINVLSSRVVIACGMGAGTASEVALALKAKRPVILLQVGASWGACFQTLTPDQIFQVDTVNQAIATLKQLLAVE